MISARDYLAKARGEIREETVQEAAERLQQTPPPALIDVRERHEYEQGFIPGAIHIPRGFLESRIERNVLERSTPIVIYCASGERSVYATKTLNELGYTDVVSMKGGFAGWKENGHEWKVPRALTPEQYERYSRHVLIPEVGEEGQLKLLDSKVLLIGAGGLGSPAAVYLAAAGVGTIGVIDADVVDVSNLQRQIVHTVDRVGMNKVDSAEIAIKGINPEVNVVKYTERLTSENVLSVITGYDVIVDGTDNFPTRYLLNDASLVAGIPVVHGSIYQFEGSVTVYKPYRGPVLPLPVPGAAAARVGAVVRRGRSAGDPSRRDRLAAGDRGSQAAARHRHPADRPAAALRRARDGVRRAEDAARSRLPCVQQGSVPDRVHRLRAVLRATLPGC